MGSKGYSSSRQALKRSQVSADSRSKRDSASESDSKRHFVALSGDELRGFADVEQSHTMVTTVPEGMYRHDDIEMRGEFSPAGSGINVRNDMKVEWAQR